MGRAGMGTHTLFTTLKATRFRSWSRRLLLANGVCPHFRMTGSDSVSEKH